VRDDAAMTHEDAGIDASNGILFPRRLPELARIPAPESVAHLVRWFWIPEWSLPEGETSTQELIAYPASNLWIDPDGAWFSGPTTRRSSQELRGTSWTVGALLRPAAVPLFASRPRELRDASTAVDADGLASRVAAAMTARAPATERHARAVGLVSGWLAARAPEPSEQELLANALADGIGADATITRLEHAAERLGVSPRTVQRLADRYVGLSPGEMIRRRRIQEAAERLRDEPSTPIAVVAADAGFADHTHLVTEFKRALGFVPSAYRAEAVKGDADADGTGDGG